MQHTLDIADSRFYNDPHEQGMGQGAMEASREGSPARCHHEVAEEPPPPPMNTAMTGQLAEENIRWINPSSVHLEINM